MESEHELVIPHAHLILTDAPPQYVILVESRDTRQAYPYLNNPEA